MKINKLRLQSKKNYTIVEYDSTINDDLFLDTIAQNLDGGENIIQLKIKQAETKKIINISKKIRELCSIYNALFIINERIDIAQVVNADGVHLEENSFEIEDVREITEENFIIGITIKTLEKEEDIKKIEKADYIIIKSTKNFKTEIACYTKTSKENKYIKK